MTALDVQGNWFQNHVSVDRMLERNLSDWAGSRQIHCRMLDLPSGLQEVTGKIETLPGLRSSTSWRDAFCSERAQTEKMPD